MLSATTIDALRFNDRVGVERLEQIDPLVCEGLETQTPIVRLGILEQAQALLCLATEESERIIAAAESAEPGRYAAEIAARRATMADAWATVQEAIATTPPHTMGFHALWPKPDAAPVGIRAAAAAAAAASALTYHLELVRTLVRARLIEAGRNGLRYTRLRVRLECTDYGLGEIDVADVPIVDSEALRARGGVPVVAVTSLGAGPVTWIYPGGLAGDPWAVVAPMPDVSKVANA